MIKKNDRIRLDITDMTVNGEGIGKYDGLAFFVKDAVIGDNVLAVVTKLKKEYGYARVLEVIHPSADRVRPLCPLAQRCGGCQIMHLGYEAQLKFKEKLVKNCLERLGGRKFVPGDKGTDGAEDDHSIAEIFPIIPMTSFHDTDGNTQFQPAEFRNKMQFPVGWDNQGHVVTGFYAGRTHYIVSAPRCIVSPEINNVIMDRIRMFLEKNRVTAYNEETGKGLVRHILIRNGFCTGQIMVCIVINADRLEENGVLLEQGFVNALKSLSSDKWVISSICININKNRNNVILGSEVRTLYGNPFIEEVISSRLHGMKPLTFRISPLSFFQTNPVQTVRLYDKALEFAALNGTETVWDLYCGTGTISLFLAQKAGHVYGVEIIPQAIEDARENAVRNEIGNVDFICGKSEEVFSSYADSLSPEKGLPVVVVLDPPRKGCDIKLLNAIKQAGPDRIVYVSCDPATLARDVKILCEEDEESGSYVLEKVQPVDMFPHTVHVETVCLLSKLSEAKHHISVQVDMDELDLTFAESKATYE